MFKRFNYKKDFNNGLLKGGNMLPKPKCLRCWDRGLVIGMDGRVVACQDCEVGKTQTEHKPRAQYVFAEDNKKEIEDAEIKAFEEETERLNSQVKKRGRPAKEK